jgi:hypothetical protein
MQITNGSTEHNPLKDALAYLDFGWWLLPCKWEGDRRKAPLVRDGFYEASNEPEQIRQWWSQWPRALIGVATGPSELAVLDVDVKDPAKYGPDSLAELGHAIPEDTWIAHTPSGGWHYWFCRGLLKIHSTNSLWGIGPGLDIRGNSGYAIAPSAGSGYTWDPHKNPGTLPLRQAPWWLQRPLPKLAEPRRPPLYPHHCVGLSPYADGAIARACLAIREAPNGQQRETLVREAFSIGTLAGSGGIPTDFAYRALLDAGSGMVSYDPQHPWTAKEIERVVDGCFAAGVLRPRR